MITKKGFTMIRTSLRDNLVIAKQGFTMIELLVVISIIGILATLAFTSFTTSQRQARDSQRKSDIKQYSTALEGFANQTNGLYPARPDASGANASTTLCGDINITSCPEDPKNLSDATYLYKYQSNGASSDGSSTATKYVLWAKIENSTNYWVVCSGGNSGVISQASFGVSGGDCPL